MEIPTLIQNSPRAVEIYSRLWAEQGLDAASEYSYGLALYASIQADVEALQQELTLEGTTLTRPSGVTVVNPKAKLLTAHRKQLLSVGKQMGLTSKPGKARRPGQMWTQPARPRLADLI